MKIYHKSRKLIIVDYPEHMEKENLQNKIISIIGGGLKRMYEAHEIWLYNPHTRKFNAHKNRNGIDSLLMKFFADIGINVKCNAASINTGHPVQYRFESEKDYFLFKLKF